MSNYQLLCMRKVVWFTDLLYLLNWRYLLIFTLWLSLWFPWTLQSFRCGIAICVVSAYARLTARLWLWYKLNASLIKAYSSSYYCLLYIIQYLCWKKKEILATQALYRHLTIDVITIGTKAQLLGAKFLIDMLNVPCDCTRLKAWSDSRLRTDSNTRRQQSLCCGQIVMAWFKTMLL